ncbi:hypothetical protein PVAP13_3NG150201 [Panicum virgatum]|uniref:Uncharacterized protein n=1 Tax=Panicum virgatum TaxID=38727 RepID=A0A8T0UHB0_PANVG|nr:hypothetical protein PVAP13_3NG150201 [Panicum virgatum]
MKTLKTVQFQNYRSDGAILNLAAHDPIDWPNIISIWKGLIVQKYIQNQHNIGNRVEDMLTYLETFLGESAKVLWEQWIEAFPNYYEELKRAGSNPYNFANIISSIVIGEDPELGYTTLQNERLKEIEKLTLTNWKGIKEFSQHYLYNATTAKQGYNKGIVERYFNKLPDPLGVNENILVCDDDIMDDESIYSIIQTDEVEYDEENETMEEILQEEYQQD